MIGKKISEKTRISPALPEEIVARTILTPTTGYLKGYTHTLNAYQGCAFGNGSCPFCYVRAMPIQRFATTPWGSWVKAKINAPLLLESELGKARRQGTFGRLRIFMSSATDPYQGAEARLRLTRQILHVFAESGDFGLLVIQTRSPLVERDLDLLQQLGARVIVSLTVETNREDIRRSITPTSPSIARRLLTLERLRDARIPAQAALSPLLPCDPPILADLIASRVSRVVVDTLIDGDGAHGQRSRSLGLPELLSSIGYPEWFHSPAHEQLMGILRSRLGELNVGFGEVGFNSLPNRHNQDQL